MLLWHEKKFLSTYSVIRYLEWPSNLNISANSNYVLTNIIAACNFTFEGVLSWDFFYLNLFGHLSSWLITLSIFNFDFKFSEILEFSLVPRILSTVYRRFHSAKYQYTQFHATYFEKFTVKSKNTGKILHSFLPSNLSTQTVSFCVFSFYVNFTTHIISIRQI